MKDAKTVNAGPRIELQDCGRASVVTRGVPILVLFEFGWPPFDRALIL